MRRRVVWLLLVVGLTAPAVAGPPPALDPCSPAPFDRILRRYVRDGEVDYARLKATAADRGRLEEYHRALAECDVDRLDAPARLAFWLNAYNACTIMAVLERYPIRTVREVDGFFDRITHRVGGRDVTLNDIEHRELVMTLRDARTHFAIVGADRGSLPLDTQVYTAANVEALLEKRAWAFAADPRHFGIDRRRGTVYASRLFGWYPTDFIVDPRFKGGRAVEYLIPYLDRETAAFLRAGSYRLVYTDWDWELNDGSER
ncbi:MAG: DUF547 domain-containing protein [Candidatus Binatia bacterium]